MGQQTAWRSVEGLENAILILENVTALGKDLAQMELV